MKNDLNGALSEFRKVARLKPNDPWLHLWYGLALNADGDREGATSQFREAIRLSPDYAQAHYNLARALAQLHAGTEEGIVEYRAALRLKPDFPEARYGLGEALSAQCAMSFIDVVGKAEGDSIEALRSAQRVGLMKMLLPCNEAIQEFRKTLLLQPASAEAHHSIGALMIWYDEDEALKEYRAACSLAPNNATFCEDYRKLARKHRHK